MVFDAHSDLLYDVTRRRLLGERRVLEHHHLDRLRRGGVEGLVLAVWASGPRETFWKDTAWKDPASNLGRTHQIFACARADLAECPQIRPVHTAAEAEAARQRAKSTPSWRWRAWAAIGGNPGRRGLVLRPGRPGWGCSPGTRPMPWPPEPEATFRRG